MYNTVNEILQAVQDLTLTAEQAGQEIEKLKSQQAAKSRKTPALVLQLNETGTLSAKSTARRFPLASLYRDEWELIVSPENVEKVREALKDEKIVNRPLKEDK